MEFVEVLDASGYVLLDKGAGLCRVAHADGLGNAAVQLARLGGDTRAGQGEDLAEPG